MKQVKFILIFIYIISISFYSTDVLAYNKTLRYGDKGNAVKSLQQFLNKELNLNLPVTGYFGVLTKNAVNKFQQKYADEILKPQGLIRPTGVWSNSSIKKASGINNLISVNNNAYKHPVFGYIPITITTPPPSNRVLIPKNTQSPIITGSTTLGSVLSLSTGDWTSGVTGYVYRWARDNIDILNAVSNNYVLTVNDLGKTIRAFVSALYDGGNIEVSSSNNLSIPFNSPLNVVAPDVSGINIEGSTLTVSNGTWASDATTTYSYQWMRDSVDISDATSSTYVLNYLDPGKNISARVYAANGGGVTVATSSNLIAVALPVVDKIAFMGDSITAQSTIGVGTTNSPYTLQGSGYPVWAYVFNDSKWDFTVNPVSGNTLTFATGGATTTTIINSYLSSVLSSDADVVVDMMGVNDVSQSVSASTTLANKINLWNQLRSVGKKPVTMAITPMSTTLAGNTAGEKSAKIVELNTLLKSTALSMGVPWVEYDGLLETSPNTGVAEESNFTDGLHPNGKGANVIGRYLATKLSENFNFVKNNWSNTNWITPNTSFAGSSGQPTGWTLSMASGAILNSKSLETSDDGNWWVLDVNVGTSTSLSSFTTFSSNIGGSPANKIVDSMVEVQVVSGNFRSIRLSMNASGGTGTNHVLSNYSNFDNAIKPEDGIIELRAPITTLGSGTTLAFPSVYFSGTGVIKFRRAGVRDTVQ